MPLDYQQNINDNCKVAIWCIQETEFFFTAAGVYSPVIRHPHKRLQHLAARYLLKQLYHDFPLHEIEIHPAGKPFLAGERYWFSVSHCDNEAAAIVSERKHVGVDIETVSEKVAKVKHKFVSAKENGILQSSFDRCQLKTHEQLNAELLLLTIAWSVKEAVFKWDGRGAIDFLKHMQIESLEIKQGLFSGACRFLKNANISLPFHGVFFREKVLSWVEA